MENIERFLLDNNSKFQWKQLNGEENIDFNMNFPKYPLLIFTDMDPRIDVHRIFQLKPGDVFILRNAGNIVTPDIIRSLLIAIHEYQVNNILILVSLNSLMTRIDLLDLKDSLLPAARKYICRTTEDPLYQISHFFQLFKDELRNLRRQAQNIRNFQGFPSDVKILCMLYDASTGWVFNEEEFKNVEDAKDFKEIYDTKIKEKYLNLIDQSEKKNEFYKQEQEKKKSTFNQIRNEEIKTRESNNLSDGNDQISKLNLDKLQEFNLQIAPELLLSKYKIKIQIPKIKVPQIKVYKPNSYKRAKKQ